MKIRKAILDDLHLYYQWANDNDVRLNSFSTAPIPFQEHEKWFLSQVSSKTTVMFVLEQNHLPVGQIRISIDGKVGTINYSIDKAFRGKGLGLFLIKNGIEQLGKECIKLNYLKALVKINNKASQIALEKAGFVLIDKNSDPLEFRFYFNQKSVVSQ